MAKKIKKVWLLWDEQEGTMVGIYTSTKKLEKAITSFLLSCAGKYKPWDYPLYWWEKHEVNP